MRITFRVLPFVALAALAIGMVLTPATLAQDAASLEAAVTDFYEKLNNEDADYGNYFLPGTYQFPRTGLLLQPNGNADSARSNIEAGLDFEVTVHHLDTQIFGDTGVATYYTTGTTTYPDGVVLTGTHRGSLIARWQGNQWRWIHVHLSELETEPD